MATSSILKEMFYGLVASVGDNFSTIHITVYNIAFVPRFSKSGVKKNGRRLHAVRPGLRDLYLRSGSMNRFLCSSQENGMLPFITPSERSGGKSPAMMECTMSGARQASLITLAT